LGWLLPPVEKANGLRTAGEPPEKNDRARRWFPIFDRLAGVDTRTARVEHGGNAVLRKRGEVEKPGGVKNPLACVFSAALKTVRKAMQPEPNANATWVHWESGFPAGERPPGCLAFRKINEIPP
jgi:hypothetical protein